MEGDYPMTKTMNLMFKIMGALCSYLTFFSKQYVQ